MHTLSSVKESIKTQTISVFALFDLMMPSNLPLKSMIFFDGC